MYVYMYVCIYVRMHVFVCMYCIYVCMQDGNAYLIFSNQMLVICLIIYNQIETFSPKGSGKKQRKNVKKPQLSPGFQPRPQALATGALTTELRQPSTSKTLTFFLYTVEQYCLLQSRTQQTTNYVPSEHLF